MSDVKDGKNKGHRWKKGESGNPKGRPRNGQTMTELLKAMAGVVPDTITKGGKQETRAYREIASQRMWQIACFGQPGEAIKAYCAIRDSLEGKPKEAIEVSGGERPVQITGFEIRVQRNADS